MDGTFKDHFVRLDDFGVIGVDYINIERRETFRQVIKIDRTHELTRTARCALKGN